MKVGFATHDLRSVNAGFHDANFFLIYDVDALRTECVRSIPINDDWENGNLEAIDGRVEAVRECAILCMRYFEEPSTARLVGANVNPVVISGQTCLIEDVLRRLQVVLRGHAAPWLKKIYAASNPPPFMSNVVYLPVRLQATTSAQPGCSV
jgi:nitrogen fixation protein NifX